MGRSTTASAASWSKGRALCWCWRRRAPAGFRAAQTPTAPLGLALRLLPALPLHAVHEVGLLGRDRFNPFVDPARNAFLPVLFFRDGKSRHEWIGSRVNFVADGRDRSGQKASYVLRVLDGATGNNLGAVLVDTGNLSFKVRWAFAVRDTVLVGDSNNRTLVYSLKSGEQKGKVFGSPRAISNTGDRMLLENAQGDTDLYDTSTFQSLAHFTFPSRITYSQFSSDDSSIFVLTADQMVYNLKNPEAAQDAAVH